MQNFDWTKFTIRIAIKADKQTLYDAWAKPSEIEKWFLKSCTYSDNGNAIGKNGSASAANDYEWRWWLYSEVENGKIKQADASDLFSFSFAGDCLVEVKFSEKFDHTVVELTQSNIPEDDASKKNYRLGCHDGWSFYLVNLKSVYEGGLDLRGKDDRFPPYVNG
ncbi:SRPBCC domain-containing protein [Flavobacterium sp. MAH-1]|uniref:SRPBCC domain-containing protein n=1 Tax=Flavobacterium agri TaxID=2743471 RepID=A0A7Y8Y4S0_9FLAO|nr:SRPBCC domain-containing protein [Flavobacterium agri]NUY82482.1 SRPBCC domain-containing protein [Flavobacterium agri]NYA72506.1 SRPBCC domain-containing protein [Flavobacterium agri]